MHSYLFVFLCYLIVLHVVSLYIFIVRAVLLYSMMVLFFLFCFCLTHQGLQMNSRLLAKSDIYIDIGS